MKFAAGLVGSSILQPMEGHPSAPVAAVPGESGITFIGHSSFFVQMGGRNLLIDPVFSKWLMLLRRLRRPGVSVSQLPPIDAVLISHAHMDHLNLPSLRQVVGHTRKLTGCAPVAVVPKGVGDLVAALGFAAVEQLEWWQTYEVAGVEIVFTPARHWGARMFHDAHRGFGGYVMRYGGTSVYHSGDTAYFDGFREIGRRLQPQVALLPIGAYRPASFRRVHTSPEDAVQAFLDLGSNVLVPMHYGTFRLSEEPMEEPLPRLLAAARSGGVEERVRALAEGETMIVPDFGAAERSRVG